MKIEFIPFEAERSINRSALAQGVTTAECVYAGDYGKAKIHDYIRRQIEAILPVKCRIGTVEIYDTGAINLFVKHSKETPAIGFVRCRYEG